MKYHGMRDMNGKWFMIGFLLIFLGMILIISLFLISFVTTKEITIGGGALIMIGPIPIFIGAGIPPLILIFFIIMMFIIMIFQIYIFLRYRKMQQV